MKIRYARKELPWIKVSERHPTEFALVRMLYDKGVEKTGWWSGKNWDSKDKKTSNDVIAWRKL